MGKVILSIVIPAYNAEKHIESILKSLFDQWQCGVEVIVIDDGSIDKTASIVESIFNTELAAGKLQLIRQANAGVSVARNWGVNKAQGDYIGFVDADDILMSNYIETILKCIRRREGAVDIFEFGYKTFSNSADEIHRSKSLFTNYKFGLKHANKVLNHVYAISRWYPWTRIIKKELFGYGKFPPGVRFCEDLMTIPVLYENATVVEALSSVLYGYRLNPNGATLNVQDNYLINLADYYKTVPTKKDIRFDLLRFSIVYALFSCNIKSERRFQIPEFIENDIKRIRLRFSVYFYLEIRKILIVFFPVLFKKLSKIVKIFK